MNRQIVIPQTVDNALTHIFDIARRHKFTCGQPHVSNDQSSADINVLFFEDSDRVFESLIYLRVRDFLECDIGIKFHIENTFSGTETEIQEIFGVNQVKYGNRLDDFLIALSRSIYIPRIPKQAESRAENFTGSSAQLSDIDGVIDLDETPQQKTKPWEQIPDHSWNRKAVELLHKGYSSPEIGGMVGRSAKTVDNRLSILRSQYPEIVPTRDEIRGRNLE